MIITLSILWIIYASLDGIAQGFYYDLYPVQKGHKNIHWLFTIQRFITCASMTIALLYTHYFYQGAVFMVACAFIFSFFHNGFYYATRNFLDERIYQKGFWDDSDSSKAVLNITCWYRVGMLIIGIAFIIGLIYDK